MSDDENVSADESGAVTREDRLNALNDPFMAVMSHLDAIHKVFVELDEEEGRDEVSEALEHVQEAWMARNRKLYELSAEPS